MTPYGIVYRDNPYALEKSVEIWQKKFGVFNIKTFVKIGVPSAIIIPVISFLLELFAKENNAERQEISVLIIFLFFIAMVVLSIFMVYRVAKSTYVKQMALTNVQKDDKQIILYEDRLEYGTAYARSTYYYSDIILCHEEEYIITIIVDTSAMPLSIQTSSVSKGSYDEFSFILRNCIGSKYQYMGGKK
jgi:hypothetical protein